MIYFVQCKDAVKIGYSSNPHRRISQMQTGSPYKFIVLGTMNGEMNMEEFIHKKFSKHRIIGEWFRLHQEICFFIEENCKNFNPNMMAIYGRKGNFVYSIFVHAIFFICGLYFNIALAVESRIFTDGPVKIGDPDKLLPFGLPFVIYGLAMPILGILEMRKISSLD